MLNVGIQMGIEYESIVDHPRDDVFAWHTRPGAMTRLIPPWQPMTVVAETASLADGTAVLGLPGGLRWVAKHDPAGYDPPHRFVDVLSSDGVRSWPARIVARWRHTHEFDDAPDGGTRVFVSASAVGYYGFDRGDAPLSEESTRGDGFLADVVAEWEAATGPAAEAGRRVVVVRTGVVQAARGGTLRLMRPLFVAGLGGRLGSGRQWLSWVGLDDLLDVYYRAVYDERLAGPVNAVSPNPVRNADYTNALARVLHRPALLPVPSLGPRLLLGEQGARELAEADQRVMPVKLQALGHRFRQPLLDEALAHQLGHG
jgi:uncharacterized protein (TIGR01777 family)